jgi:cytochrome P450
MADDAAPLTAPKPAHVPDALVYDFDMFRDPALLADPHARVRDLVENAPPVFWTPRNRGHWVVTSFEANFDLSRDTETFSSEIMPRAMRAQMEEATKGMPRLPHMTPIFLDPPDHTRYRMPLASAFAPKTMKALRGEIQAFAKGLVAGVAPAGRCEFMSAIAEPLPVHVFLKLMGLPLDRMREYRDLVAEIMATAGEHSPEASARRMYRVLDGMRPSFIERRDNPQDDLISRLWALKIDGEPTTIEDLEDFGALLFMAGLDTVMLAMGFAARHLAADQDLQARLRANPELIPDANEEMLRRYTFISPPRRVAKDVVFHGAPMKAEDRVIQYLPGTGMDHRHFPDPTRYDLEREDKVHMVFNSGPHRCLGSHLARIELQVLYEELLAGLPPFRIDPQQPPVFHGGHNLGIASLHLVWDA